MTVTGFVFTIFSTNRTSDFATVSLPSGHSGVRVTVGSGLAELQIGNNFSSCHANLVFMQKAPFTT